MLQISFLFTAENQEDENVFLHFPLGTILKWMVRKESFSFKDNEAYQKMWPLPPYDSYYGLRPGLMLCDSAC